MTEGSAKERLCSFLDVRDPSVIANPYPTYHRLRASHPVLQFAPGHWLVSSFHAEDLILRSDAVSPPGAGSRGPLDNEVLFLLHSDRQRQLHRFLADWLARWLETASEMILHLADQLVERAMTLDHPDLMREIALPLPFMVLTRLLGVSDEGAERIRRLSARITRLLDPMPPFGIRAQAVRAGADLFKLADQLIASSIRAGRPGLVSDLRRQMETDTRLTEGTLVGTVMMFLVAGHETTSNLIGNALRLFVSNPQGCRAKAATGLPASVRIIDEVLRFDSPVQVTGRIVRTSLTVDGHSFSEGDKIFLLIGAANRDPLRFSRPDEFDVTRAPSSHLAFSAGPHYCIGASLGRLEAAATLSSFLRRKDALKLLAEPMYREHFAMRGLRELRVLTSTLRSAND